MGQPILKNYNFKIERKINKGKYSMRSMDTYHDYHSFGYLYSGNRIVITPEKTCTVTPGTIVFLHKDMPHRTTGKLDIDYENFSIKFRECVIERLIQEVGETQVQNLFSQIAIQLSTDADKRVQEVLNSIEEEWNNYNDYSNLMLECLFTEMMLIIIKDQANLVVDEDGLSEKQKILLDAMNYLEGNYQNDPSLDETAKAINVSASYLSKVFSTEMNSTYSKYLVCLKIGHAQKLLANTELSVLDISLQTGFKNYNYFSDVFKKMVGCTPTWYRKRG